MTYLGGSVAYLWSQVNLWQGRANQAWGTSRNWSSGASWEQNYLDEVAAYNSLLGSYNALVSQYNTLLGQYNQAAADRDTWANRANQAWGPSRSWSVGASFEASYPADLTVYSVGVPGQNCSGGDHEIAGFTVGITGQYMVSFMVGLNPAQPSGANNQWCNLKVNVGGVGQVMFITTALSGVSLVSRGGAYWQGAISAGQRVSLTAGNSGSSTGEGGLVAAFIPTKAQAH